ncbi:PD-(D/E)XK nuclease family protein, partial [Vibrio rotiferianus]
MYKNNLDSRVYPLLLNLLRDPDYQILKKTHYSNSFLGDYVKLQETQMCQVLNWLFDPQEGHGQQDFFVKRLLMTVLSGEHPYLDEVEQLEILSSDYHGVQVLTEFT